MPKVSVLMPVYRTPETFLREAIDSILSQTYTDFEFLILDDCPEDSRETIVRSYADPRIVYLKNERNLGITPSRNRLIERARGDYLAVFDHDDLSLPTRFEKQVAFLDAHPDYGVVGSWTGSVGRSKVSRYLERDEDIRITLMWDCAVAHSASMIRRSVLMDNNIRYEDYFSPAEDYGLWCRLVAVTKFSNLQEVLFLRRSHGSNTSNTQADRMLVGGHRVRALNKTVNAVLWNEFEMRAVRTWRIRLFGILPLLDIRQENRKTQIKCLGLPILKIRSWVRMWR